ncbi:MAG: mannose/fructose/N-acetylgalactosamine-specific phosphotransferase system component IIB [Bradymonadia bacterium]|jgi:mannose/fructose/N-acetylgalactosamine-specific phosphotransferase system component IIB
MTPRPRLHLDDRGVSRTLLELWIPAIDPDVIWIVGGDLPGDELRRGTVPFIGLSAVDAAAVAAEPGATDLRVLAVFCSIHALKEAAAMGLSPDKVTVSSLGDQERERRVAATLHLNADELTLARTLEERGWTFAIQSLPNVTPRCWRPSEESGV